MASGHPQAKLIMYIGAITTVTMAMPVVSCDRCESPLSAPAHPAYMCHPGAPHRLGRLCPLWLRARRRLVGFEDGELGEAPRVHHVNALADRKGDRGR
jgi:hypothetical protein